MRLTVERKLTPLEIAEAFCELDDESQAQVFIEAARIAAGWGIGRHSLGADWQWFSIGRHLRTCSCSTEEARDMVKAIADGAVPSLTTNRSGT